MKVKNAAALATLFFLLLLVALLARNSGRSSSEAAWDDEHRASRIDTTSIGGLNRASNELVQAESEADWRAARALSVDDVYPYGVAFHDETERVPVLAATGRAGSSGSAVIHFAGEQLSGVIGVPAFVAPSALCVVMLHGAAFSAATWQEIGLVDEVVRSGHVAVAVDLPPKGTTLLHRSAPMLLPDLLPCVCGDARAVVLSASASGKYALPFVTSNPSQLAGFIAVAPVGVGAHSSAFHSFRSPLLALYGGRDPRVADLPLLEAAPHSSAHVYPGAAHACYLDVPERFARDVVEFLTSLST